MMGLKFKSSSGDPLRFVFYLPFIFSTVALLIMMVTIVLNVLLRMIIGQPILGTVEIAKLTGLIVISFCIPYVQFNKGNVFVDFIYTRLKKKAKTILSILSYLFIILLSALTLYALYLDFIVSYNSGEESEILNWPLFPFKVIWASSWLSLVAIGVLQLLRKEKGR